MNDAWEQCGSDSGNSIGEGSWSRHEYVRSLISTGSDSNVSLSGMVDKA